MDKNLDEKIDPKQPPSHIIEHKDILINQYNILVESINKINETRELSNQFWMAANAAIGSLLAYLKDLKTIQCEHKSMIFIVLIAMGVVFCFSWINYLWSIQNFVAARTNLVIEIEKKFGMPLFTKIFRHSEQEDSQKPAQALLTLKEMFVPLIFLCGYIFFAVLFYLSPTEFSSPTKR